MDKSMWKNVKSRIAELEIPRDNPFKNCKLGRSQYASILTDIVSVYEESGCVLALDGGWGTGKTTFVKMWMRQLEAEGFKTLYFNAWESDYAEDPLGPMIAGLKEVICDDGTFNRIVSIGGRIMLAAANAAAKRVTGGSVDEICDTVASIGGDCLKRYAERKKSLEEFKEALERGIAGISGGRCVVFFIDELDRCNPAYAVKVLERVKHLFDIPGMVFVLAINKGQLACAVQGYFGSQNMDADEYLRRFIDIEYALPEPSMELFCGYLYDEYGFDEFFNGRHYDERRIFVATAEILAQGRHLTLRTVDKIFAHARLALLALSRQARLSPGVFFLLCFWRTTDAGFYAKIRHHDLSVQQLLSEVEARLDGILRYERENNHRLEYKDIMTYDVAELLFSYNIRGDGHKYEPSLSWESLDSIAINKENFINHIDYFRNGIRPGLSVTIDCIELASSLRVG